MDFNDLIASVDADVMDVLGDKTVTIQRGAGTIASGIKVIHETGLQVTDGAGFVSEYSNGFTVNKADLTVSALQEYDKIDDGSKVWTVRKPLIEDATMITVAAT